MTTKTKSRRLAASSTSPAKHLETELVKLRNELRQTLQVYSARLEIQLAQSMAALRASQIPDELPRDRVHQLRDLTVMMRRRKVKPEKGRRKDLRKIDALITDVHTFVPNGAQR